MLVVVVVVVVLLAATCFSVTSRVSVWVYVWPHRDCGGRGARAKTPNVFKRQNGVSEKV